METSEVVYLKSIVVPLLSAPEGLNIDHRVDQRGIYIVVTVSQVDMGRIIGKSGETANSIRRIMRQFGLGQQKVISIKINEPEGGNGSRPAYHSMSEDRRRSYQGEPGLDDEIKNI